MPTLQEIRDAIGGELHGDGQLAITGVQSLSDAGANDIAPFDDPNYVAAAHESKAGAILVTPALAEELDGARIVHEFPVFAMNTVIEMLGLAPRSPAAGVHPTAMVSPDAVVPASCSIGSNVIIEGGARLGERCVVRANALIESGVEMGDDCAIDPCAVLHTGAVLGDRVVIGTGAVISRQGFGFTPGPNGPVHIHHVGRVEIGNDSSIGACCSIDRARFGATRVGTMSGLDYGVHLGHNSRVGDRSYVAAQTGLAGHAFVGNDCAVGGQAGFANHSGVGDHSLVGAQCGLIRDYGPKRSLWGTPAMDKKMALRMNAALKRLADGKKRAK